MAGPGFAAGAETKPPPSAGLRPDWPVLVRVSQRNAQIGATVMPTAGKYRGGVLVLPGGKPESTATSHPLQLANQRLEWLARSLRRRLGSGVVVRRLQYRVRGWNSAGLDALRDATIALDSMREHFDAAKIVVVGHSMGGRVAAHVSASGDVGAVVALAPWWPRDDADLIPNTCRLLVLHGTADTWTDPHSSYRQTLRARDRGVDAQWMSIERAGHFLFRQWPRWHQLTAQFAASRLSERLLEP